MLRHNYIRLTCIYISFIKQIDERNYFIRLLMTAICNHTIMQSI